MCQVKAAVADPSFHLIDTGIAVRQAVVYVAPLLLGSRVGYSETLMFLCSDRVRTKVLSKLRVTMLLNGMRAKRWYRI
jgi:hypothetical protein